MNTLVNYIRLCRDYAEFPNPGRYTYKEVGMIWLYTACMMDEFPLIPIVPERKFDELSNYILDNWHKMPSQLRCSIPLTALTLGTPKGVIWDRDVALSVYDDVEKYNKIRKRSLVMGDEALKYLHACC